MTFWCLALGVQNVWGCNLVLMLRKGGATYTIPKRIRFECHARWHSSIAFN